MRITYMIGNGFDIALGLKTRYSDFIDYYCKQDKSADPFLVKLQKEMQNTDEEHRRLWSCAETAFAEMDWSAFAPENTEDVFKRCFADFQRELDAYLQREARRVQVPKEDARKLGETLFSNMLSLDRFLSFGHAAELRQQIGRGNDEMNFIVFNYTDIIERLVDALQVQQKDNRHHFEFTYNNARSQVIVNRPCFVHGAFVHSPFLFGVDDPSQVKDEKIRNVSNQSGKMIKPYMDEDWALGFAKRARDIIANSEMIVTFGLSFGSSDNTWWRLLHQHVFASNRALVYCPYYPTKQPVVHSGDAHVDNIQAALRCLFGSIKDPSHFPEDFNRQRIRCVKVLNDTETEIYNGREVRCDYFDLTSLGESVVSPAECVVK